MQIPGQSNGPQVGPDHSIRGDLSIWPRTLKKIACLQTTGYTNIWLFTQLTDYQWGHSLSQQGVWESFGCTNPQKTPLRTSKSSGEWFPKMSIWINKKINTVPMTLCKDFMHNFNEYIQAIVVISIYCVLPWKIGRPKILQLPNVGTQSLNLGYDPEWGSVREWMAIFRYKVLVVHRRGMLPSWVCKEVITHIWGKVFCRNCWWLGSHVRVSQCTWIINTIFRGFASLS